MKHWIAAAAIVLVSSPAFAQSSSGGWQGLNLSELSTVYVRDTAGSETTGKLLRFDPTSLVVLVDGAERRFDVGQVSRIQKRGDSLKNGAIIGAVVGTLFGAVGAAISDCPGRDPGGHCGGSRVALFAFSAGVYSAIGVGIDALIPGRTTLYEAPSASSGRRQLLLSAGRSLASANFSWSW